MSQPFHSIDLKNKIDAISISPYDWSKNLICIAFKEKIVAGIIKFQEEFDDLDQEVELETTEEFFHGPKVHHIAWNPTSSLHKLPKVLVFCAAGSDFSLRVFTSNLSTRKTVRKEIAGHEDYINSCCYDIEGAYLASVSDDLTCKLWDANDQYELLTCFNLTSPGMSVCWNAEQPHKLIVAEKAGLFRMYSSLTLTPMVSISCCPAPLISAEWPTPNHIAYLAAGVLHRADISIPGHMVENKTVHAEGGYSLAVCPINQNYISTAGRPNNSLKITNIKTEMVVLNTDLKLFGGFSWHSRLPILCVANNSNLCMFKISPK